MVHGYSHAGYVLNRVRRSAVPIDKQSCKICIEQAEQDLKGAAREFKVDEGEEEGEFDPWTHDTPEKSIGKYDFSQRTLFLNAYLIGKLNTDLHDKTKASCTRMDLSHTDRYAKPLRQCRRTPSFTLAMR